MSGEGPTREDLDRLVGVARNLRRFFNSGSDDLDTVMRMEQLLRAQVPLEVAP